MDKKRITRDRWIFNQRVKECSRKEVEDFLWKRQRGENFFFILMIACALGFVFAMAFAADAQMQKEDNLEMMIDLGHGLCREVYDQGLTDIEKFQGKTIIYCESEFMTIRSDNG